mgnify:CR=1 FL=1
MEYNIELCEENHTYKVNGMIKPSVSHKINLVMNGGNPIPDYAIDSVQKGTMVHKIIKLGFTTGVDIESIDERFKGWYDSFSQLKEELHLRAKCVEKIFYDDISDTCMTVDYVGHADFAAHLIDWKTGGLYKKYRAQMGGYCACASKIFKHTEFKVALGQIFKDGKKGRLVYLDKEECIKDFESVNRIYNILTSKEK